MNFFPKRGHQFNCNACIFYCSNLSSDSLQKKKNIQTQSITLPSGARPTPPGSAGSVVELYPFDVESGAVKNLPNTFRLRGALFIRDRVLLVNYAPGKKNFVFRYLRASKKENSFVIRGFLAFVSAKGIPHCFLLTFSWENHYGLGKLPGCMQTARVLLFMVI